LDLSGVEAHRDAHLVFAGRAIGEGHEPDHKRVSDGKTVRLDVGKHAENGVFARAGVHVDAIAGEPTKQLGLGLHLAELGGRREAGQIILLAVARGAGE
jgi:hypothetical protein